MESFSQNNEDMGICNYFDHLINTAKLEDMSFKILDIGANDGITFSNSHRLLKLFPKFQCYFVEPHPEAMKRLKENYKEEIEKHQFFEFALSDTDSKLVLHMNGSHLKKGDVGLLSTLDQAEKDRWGDTEQWEDIEVEVKRYPFAHEKFDFISIDAEGQDETILRQIDLTHTKCLCIEWNSKDPIRARIDEYCNKFGMTCIFTCAENLIYARV